MYATITDFWADRAQWMRDAYRKYGADPDTFADFLAMDGLPIACFDNKILDLCKAGDFLAAARIANMDGWM